MPSPKYPLKPLLEHRERAATDATAELGNAVRRRETADAARARTELARRSAEERAAEVRANEEERLLRGELRVADLAQGASWEVGAGAQIAELTRSVEVAERQLAEARSGEESSRLALSQKLADRDVVAKDQARFDERNRKRAGAAEEEAAEEAFRGGSKGRKGSDR